MLDRCHQLVEWFRCFHVGVSLHEAMKLEPWCWTTPRTILLSRISFLVSGMACLKRSSTSCSSSVSWNTWTSQIHACHDGLFESLDVPVILRSCFLIFLYFLYWLVQFPWATNRSHKWNWLYILYFLMWADTRWHGLHRNWKPGGLTVLAENPAGLTCTHMCTWQNLEGPFVTSGSFSTAQPISKRIWSGNFDRQFAPCILAGIGATQHQCLTCSCLQRHSLATIIKVTERLLAFSTASWQLDQLFQLGFWCWCLKCVRCKSWKPECLTGGSAHTYIYIYIITTFSTIPSISSLSAYTLQPKGI